MRSLSLSVMLLLAYCGQALLLAPNRETGLAAQMNDAVSLLTGAAYFVQSMLLTVSVLFAYENRRENVIRISSAIFLVVAGLFLSIHWYWLEATVCFSLAAGMFMEAVFTPQRDNLVVTIQWLEVTLGGIFLFAPQTLGWSHYQVLIPVRVGLGFIFLISGAASMLGGLVPAWKKVKSGRLLALPWLLYLLLFLPPFQVIGISIGMSLGLGLALSEFIPWNRVVLRSANPLGKRFLILITVSQVILLISIVVFVRFIESNTAILPEAANTLREGAMLGYNLMAALGVITMGWINLTINGVLSGLENQSPPPPAERPISWAKKISNLLFEPFTTSQIYASEALQARQEYEALLARQLKAEKRRVAQLSLLQELNLNLESVLEHSAAAKLTINAIHNHMDVSLAVVLYYHKERDELEAIATTGESAFSVPVGYQQSLTRGVVGRAARTRQTQLVQDTRQDPDYIQLEEKSLSELAVPLVYHNELRGVLVLNHHETRAFDESDVRTAETAASQLVTAWMRSEHDQRLTSLINAGITLSTTLDTDGLIQEITEIARRTLQAQFVFVALLDRSGSFTRTAQNGYAPSVASLLSPNPDKNPVIQTVLNNSTPLRLHDISKRFAEMKIPNPDLRSFLAAPIRLRQSTIGAILAFGKASSNQFTENDEALISLLGSQSAASIETTWLYQELRVMLATATQLYQLSTRVVQTEKPSEAASVIVETAYQMSKGDAGGIILLSKDGHIEAQMQIDRNGLNPQAAHPAALIQQALEARQTLIFAGPNDTTRVCIPLQTPRRQYGALWIDIEEEDWSNTRFTDNMHTLANQAAIALERSLLLTETRQQAQEIKEAYLQLENTYDQTLGALSSALDARDRETEGHSLRVARVACLLGRKMGLDDEQAKIMERGAILHDIGKIGISDSILLKPGPLTPEEWALMRQHPDIGARIIENIPFLKEALPVIRYHQERWNGSGYPIGLIGTDIPLMARIFAVVDAFDALTNERPYRKPISHPEAFAYLREQASILFDPQVVETFIQTMQENPPQA